jgi:hypothetical protein
MTNIIPSQLAAYLFAITQAEEKVKKTKNITSEQTSQIYHSTATLVKETMSEISGNKNLSSKHQKLIK